MSGVGAAGTLWLGNIPRSLADKGEEGLRRFCTAAGLTGIGSVKLCSSPENKDGSWALLAFDDVSLLRQASKIDLVVDGDNGQQIHLVTEVTKPGEQPAAGGAFHTVYRTFDLSKEDGKAVLMAVGGKRYVAREAVTETDAYAKNGADAEPAIPNMLFVPMKTREPHVPAREFAVFIFMLVAFTSIHSNQHFHADFLTNSGMADMCNVYTPNVGFVHIATTGDYSAWWPSLVVAFTSWMQHRDSVAANLTALPTSGPAVLMGRPLVMQRRLPGSVLAINGTAGFECLWTPTDYGHGEGPTCYGASMGWSGADPLMGEDGTPGRFGADEVMYLDHIEDIINAGTAWDPADWIDSATAEIVHYFQVWLPTEQRIATVKIAASFDRTGRVQPRDRDKQLPVFRTQEPFSSTTIPLEHYGEILFYCIMAYYLFDEFHEVWSCICMQELLLPLQILVDAFELSLLEITYYHAKTSEVYDPRDPKTHAAFTFPDTRDLEDHLNLFIKPIRDTLEREDQQLKTARVEIASMSKDARSNDRQNYMSSHRRVVKLHEELMQTHAALDREIEIAETAAILQLAVMWHNHWSMDFPPKYLNDLGNPDAGNSIGEDGQAAFCAVNWINVARDYNDWVETGIAHETVHHKNEGGHFQFKTHRLGIMGESRSQWTVVKTGPGRAQNRQHKHFIKLAPLVDYLNMLRDTLSLHQQLVSARSIRYWNGPRIDTGHTIDQAFQRLIKEYNETGYGLMEEMRSFPDEIMNGFHDPDGVKAETTKINARRIQKDLLSKLATAQTLGFYFPGSAMWELRRKLREAGEYDKSEGLRHSLNVVPEDATIVSSGSMDLYVQAGDTAGADSDIDVSKPTEKDTKPNQKQKLNKNQKKRNGSVANPMHELDLQLVDSDDDDDQAYTQDAEPELAELLKQVPCFSKLVEEDIAAMALGCEVVEYDSHAVIIEEGDEDVSHMYVLTDGGAAVFNKGINDGRPRTYYRRGELFGERGWFSRTGRTATVKAEQGGATCLRLDKRAYDVLSKSSAAGVLDGDYETAGEAASIDGTPCWRDWVPYSARDVVNHDGQFFDVRSGMLDMVSKRSYVYPLWLYVSQGVQTYGSNGWNVIEFSLYSLFMVAFYCKIEMWRLEPVLEQSVVKAINGEAAYVDVVRFDYLAWLYMMTLTPNACMMWIKLFKYIGMVPQMDILIRVLSMAVPSVTIFTFVAIIPVLGLAYSFTAVFGDSLYRYSTVSLSLNALLRMAVGDFDFDELFEVNPTRAVVMFWLSALLIIFCLINIFVAIILNAYDHILKSNPDANDASQFISMVIMQAKRTAMGALAMHHLLKRDSLEPHVLHNQMERIEDETYWDIFEGYFTLGGKGIEKAMREHADELGGQLADERSASSGTNSRSAVSASAVDTQLQKVARTVDEIAAKQRGYEQQASKLATQQAEILKLLKAMHGKAGS